MRSIDWVGCVVRLWTRSVVVGLFMLVSSAGFPGVTAGQETGATDGCGVI